eukprot:SAG31_NODE_2013_length_6665_cov_2.751295_4_plen_88_part_00
MAASPTRDVQPHAEGVARPSWRHQHRPQVLLQRVAPLLDEGFTLARGRGGPYNMAAVEAERTAAEVDAKRIVVVVVVAERMILTVAT